MSTVKFLVTELMARRDKILYDKDIDSMIKEGALQQLCSLIDMIFGNGLTEITKIIQLKSKPLKEEQNLNKEQLRDQFKNKVLS